MYNQTKTNQSGVKKGKMSFSTFHNRFSDGRPYHSVKTGVADYLGDEIILTVFPDTQTVTDEGYTEFVLNGERRPKRIKEAKQLISAHGVTISDSYHQELSLTYEGDDWTDAVKKLVSCIVDVYSILIK